MDASMQRLIEALGKLPEGAKCTQIERYGASNRPDCDGIDSMGAGFTEGRDLVVIKIDIPTRLA